MKLPADFDLHALQVFVTTVEAGGMSQAATQLHVTQSAVSQAIARLEAAVGMPLFDRRQRPLGLTPGGRALLGAAHDLLAQAKQALAGIRDERGLPAANINVAMSFSLASLLTVPLLERLGPRASRWSIRSGISREHQSAFLVRDLDMLVTGSFNLEHRGGLEMHRVFGEDFVAALPGRWTKPFDFDTNLPALPFARFTLLSGMGQQIERQLARMKLRLPMAIEVDSSYQQLALVAAGLGWTVTSPACIAAVPELHDAIRVEPLPRSRFKRHIHVVARAGELGSLPADLAATARDALRDRVFPPLQQRYPWMAEQLDW